MSKRESIIFCAILAIGGSSLAVAPASYAFNFGNMMNPSKWMGGNNDRNYDDYGRYGYGGPYGYPGYGYGYPGYGYGYPGYGYGVPGYGYGAPGYYQPQGNQPAPARLPQ